MNDERCGRQLRTLVLAGACAFLLAGPAAAQEEEQAGEDMAAPEGAGPDLWDIPEPDTSRWRCRLCPFPEGWSGTAELGVGLVSDDSTGFGDYRGLEEEGAFPLVGGELLYRGEDGGYADVTGVDLGTDARSLSAEGGRQGRYDLRLQYDESPHFLDGDHRTVFSGAGSSNLTLPGGWVRAGTTSGMTALDGSLHDETIGWDRKTLDLGVGWYQGSHLRYDVDARSSTREGNTTRGGSFLFRSATLPAPVDYETNQLDASVAYVRDRWQLEAAYHASTFTNENRALVWDNPFTSSNNADQGRMALPPDNQFHQVALSGSWRSQGSLSVAGRVALGRMEQDESFVAPTINASLGAPDAPRNSADGEVDTRSADLRIVGRPSGRLTAKAELYYDERDNNTPRDTYTQVVTDELVGDPRTNRPYSHEKSGAELTLDYRVSPELRVTGAGGTEDHERTFQEVENTQTDTASLEVEVRPVDRFTARLRRKRELRDGSYEQLGLAPPENPDQRKFHIAERERDLTLAAFNYVALSGATLGVSVEQADDEYTESEIGLTDASDSTVSFDISAMPAEGLTTYAFLSIQEIDSRIQGADNITGAEWTYDQNDRYRTIGGGFEIADLPGGFSRGGLDITYAVGRTELDVDKPVAAPDLPVIDTELYTLNLYADRPLWQDAELRLGYLVEGFREDDFQRDGVDPDTISSVLTLGEGSPGYTVHVIQAALRYRF